MTVRLARMWRAGALFFTVLAVVFGVLHLRMRWISYHADFDVLGILWSLQNVGPIGTFALFLTCGPAAVALWVRYFLSDR